MGITDHDVLEILPCLGSLTVYGSTSLRLQRSPYPAIEPGTATAV